MECFRNFPVAKKFMDKRGGGMKSFRRKKFSLTVPKNFSGEIFTASLISGIEKCLGIREGGNTRSKNSSPSAEKFRRGTLLFCVSEIFR